MYQACDASATMRREAYGTDNDDRLVFVLGWGNKPEYENVQWLINHLVEAGYHVDGDHREPTPRTGASDRAAAYRDDIDPEPRTASPGPTTGSRSATGPTITKTSNGPRDHRRRHGPPRGVRAAGRHARLRDAHPVGHRIGRRGTELGYSLLYRQI